VIVAEETGNSPKRPVNLLICQTENSRNLHKIFLLRDILTGVEADIEEIDVRIRCKGTVFLKLA
jgi:hypothetical protein